MKELQISERTQNGIMDFATNYVRGNNIILSPNYDMPRAMSNLYLNLIQVQDKNGRSVLETCTMESIQEAIIHCINKELNVGRKQAWFIPYNGKLVLQSSYFGNVKEARSLRRININSQVIRDGEQIEMESRVDGSLIIKHKPNFKCINNKIIGAYAVGTNIDSGRVDNSDIMSIEEIKKSWAKSQNGGRTAKEFEHEFARKTVENRLAKHYINKADDSTQVFVTDANGNQIMVDNYNDLIDVDYTINTDEQIASEKEVFQPTDKHIVTAQDLHLDNLEEPSANVPEGAIEIDYNLVKGGANKNLYKVVPNTFNREKYTVMAIPLTEGE